MTERETAKPESRLYKSKYGDWAGMPEGHKPDFSRCCEEVTTYVGRWPQQHQCARKRGHGPDAAYCKQHDPIVARERREAAAAAGRKRYRKQMIEAYGASFLAALRKIADGHNDPRALASEIVTNFDQRYPDERALIQESER